MKNTSPVLGYAVVITTILYALDIIVPPDVNKAILIGVGMILAESLMRRSI